jgi:hypothetical protein
MQIRASFVADAEPLALMQPGEGALDDPAHLAQPGTVGDAASCDQRLDAALSQQAAVLVEVVAPVRVQTSGLAAGTSLPTPSRRNGVQQRQELGNDVPVAAGQRHGERGEEPWPLMLDTRDTGSCGSEDAHLVVMKNYPPEFKADAVALYEWRPGATIRSVAADLGINPETLRRNRTTRNGRTERRAPLRR